MPNIAPIGSIVRIQDVRLVVVGHRMARDGEEVGLCYLLVPYPLGFVSPQSLTLTPMRRIDEVIELGLETDAGRTYLEGLEGMVTATKGMSYDDYADGVLTFNNYAKEGVSDE